MTQATANGTGHARHSNGHPAATADMGYRHAADLPVVRVGYLSAGPVTPVHWFATHPDEVTGELTVDLEPELYAAHRSRRADARLDDDNRSVGTTVLFREVHGARPTGRWFVRRRTDAGWVTESEATIPEHAAGA